MKKKTNQEILEELVSECMVIVEQCGLELPLNINYIMNGRLSRAIGRCRTKDHKNFTIEMSTKHFEANLELGNLKEIRNTILHEMCHTMKNGFSHGEVWQRYGNKINVKFGYDISRTTKLDEEVVSLMASKFNMIGIICNSCGKSIPYKSNHKIVKHPEMYRCKCGGSLYVKK